MRFTPVVFLVALALLAAPLFAQEAAPEASIPTSPTDAVATAEESESGTSVAPAEGDGEKDLLVSPVVTLGVEGGYAKSGTYYDGPTGRMFLSVDEDAKYVRLFGELALYSDDKYAPAKANLPGGEFLGLYFMMEEGGIESDLGPFHLRAGRFRHYDVIDSPYSVFVNSNGNSALQVNLRYEDDFFFYESRWISLNDRSGQTAEEFTEAWPDGFPDRGANIKTYGFKLRNGMRLGFQDAAVYTNRAFDLEYLLSPIPQYFIQYAKTNAGRPWATGGNENDMIGLFWDWKRDDGYSYNAQVLMDDFNVFGLGGTSLNPWKLAWTVGGRKTLKDGSIGFYHAGATKYTFEPITMGEDDDDQVESNSWSAYGYTYYPDTRFDKTYDFDFSDPVSISIEDNAIGYKYGENNLAFQVDYKYEYRDSYMLSAALEFVLAGANSPSNPWQDLNKHPLAIAKLLDDDVIEKRFLAKLATTWREGSWSYSVRIDAGIRFDAMELVAPDSTDNEWTQALWIWKPQEGNTVPVLRLMLGAKYVWRMRK